jgi:hypothetical protein
MAQKQVLAALGLLAVTLGPVGANEAATSAEQSSMEGFAAAAPLCLEWTDGCAVCARDEGDKVHCSTPGVACQPGPIACRRERQK